jgi:hypothetical protein
LFPAGPQLPSDALLQLDPYSLPKNISAPQSRFDPNQTGVIDRCPDAFHEPQRIFSKKRPHEIDILYFSDIIFIKFFAPLTCGVFLFP